MRYYSPLPSFWQLLCAVFSGLFNCKEKNNTLHVTNYAFHHDCNRVFIISNTKQQSYLYWKRENHAVGWWSFVSLATFTVRSYLLAIRSRRQSAFTNISFRAFGAGCLKMMQCNHEGAKHTYTGEGSNWCSWYWMGWQQCFWLIFEYLPALDQKTIQ